jgi:hypothetical protein
MTFHVVIAPVTQPTAKDPPLPGAPSPGPGPGPGTLPNPFPDPEPTPDPTPQPPVLLGA